LGDTVVVYGMVALLVVYSVVVLTGSRVGSPNDFRAIFGKFSWRRKMDDHFSAWWKGKSLIFVFRLTVDI
jgi:hypothetical protein